MRRGQKATTKDGGEVDWIHARRLYNWSAGIGRWIKRKMNKRFRREGRAEVWRGRG